ncbi:hypothetical protein FIV07_25790 [Mycobacterium sp. THAF192]|nr:hypothetical protein FIV07_25790 [Mycobacterium sp. THAF192]
MNPSTSRDDRPARWLIAAAVAVAAISTGVALSGVTGPVPIKAPGKQIALVNSSEQHCGSIGEIAVRPGIFGAVVVESGSVSCPEALAVVDTYLSDPNTARFAGWDCAMNFHPHETAWGALVADCYRGPDHHDSILVVEPTA